MLRLELRTWYMVVKCLTTLTTEPSLQPHKSLISMLVGKREREPFLYRCRHQERLHRAQKADDSHPHFRTFCLLQPQSEPDTQKDNPGS